MKPLCPPIRDREDGDWWVNTLQDCRLAFAARQEQNFCLSWTMAPELWVLRFLVLYLLSSHFPSQFPLSPLSFSNTDLIIQPPCLTRPGLSPGTPSCPQSTFPSSGMASRPGTPRPQLLFSVTSSQFLHVPYGEVPFWFSKCRSAF